MFLYIKGGYKEDEDSLFTRNHMESTKANGKTGDVPTGHEENFSQREQLAIGVISPGKWCIPQHRTVGVFFQLNDCMIFFNERHAKVPL